MVQTPKAPPAKRATAKELGDKATEWRRAEGRQKGRLGDELLKMLAETDGKRGTSEMEVAQLTNKINRIERAFEQADADRDGVLSPKEIEQGGLGRNGANDVGGPPNALKAAAEIMEIRSKNVLGKQKESHDLTKQDVAAILEAIPPAGPGGPGGGPGGPGGPGGRPGGPGGPQRKGGGRPR